MSSPAMGVGPSPGLNTGVSQELYQIQCLSPTLRLKCSWLGVGLVPCPHTGAGGGGAILTVQPGLGTTTPTLALRLYHALNYLEGLLTQG